MANNPDNKQGMGDRDQQKHGPNQKPGQQNPGQQHTQNPGGQKQHGEERRDQNEQHKGGQR